MNSKIRPFIVWKKYQRRVEVLAPALGLDIIYFHYTWEEKSKIYKALSYIFKSIATIRYLFKEKPSLVLVQFPPTPALYCVAFYAWLFGAEYVSDCHFVIGDERWLKWIYIKKLLNHGIILAHNKDIGDYISKKFGLEPFILRDGVADNKPELTNSSEIFDRYSLTPNKFVFLPWTFSSDEPLLELFEAAKLMPNTKFVMTWYSEKLPGDLRHKIPSNVILTGYLPIDDFNHLFASAGAVVVLTKWEAVQLSGMQEAMAFEIPAVVSDLNTTRNLYKNAPVYVRNDPKSIAEGIQFALNNRKEFAVKMKQLKLETKEEFYSQVTALKKLMKLE